MNKHKIVLLLLLIGSSCWSKQLDSLRIETIKGQKYIIHLVEKGETLEMLINRYHSDLELTVKANDIKRKKLEKEQLIKIPILSDTTQITRQIAIKRDSSGVNEAHANAQTKEAIKVFTHQVSLGETTSSIAKKYKITTVQLNKWNSIKNNKLIVGQVLIVDENAAIKPYLRLNKAEAQFPNTQFVEKLMSTGLMLDSGIAVFNETGQVAHATIPIGTIVKVTNLENNQQALVKVTQNIAQEKYKNFVMILGADIQTKLKANSSMVKVKLEFFLPH